MDTIPQQAFLFEVVGIFIGMIVSKWMVDFWSRKRILNFESEIMDQFKRIWKGTPEDEYYAWLRLRMNLLQYDPDEVKLAYVERRIASFNKRQLKGRVSVNIFGELESGDFSSAK